MYKRQLRRRGTDGADTIRRRMLTARAEIEQGLAAYDYVVVNDEVDRALEQLRAILVAERCRRGRVRLEGRRLAPARRRGTPRRTTDRGSGTGRRRRR